MLSCSDSLFFHTNGHELTINDSRCRRGIDELIGFEIGVTLVLVGRAVPIDGATDGVAVCVEARAADGHCATGINVIGIGIGIAYANIVR